MGTWGVAVFADDLAADVRDEWREAILDGRDVEATTQALRRSFEIEDDPDDPASVVFWLALAAAQMETGRLSDSVRDRAVAIIDAGGDIELWREENPGLARQRGRVLERLRGKLVGPQSKPKRLRRPTYLGVLFDPGDVVLLRNPVTGDRGLVYVVDRSDERNFPDPVVEVLIWDGQVIPTDDELTRLPAVRLVPGAGRGLDGKLRPLFHILHTWRVEEAFGPHLGEVIAKGIEREPPADWRRGALSVSSPCYTDLNLTWPRLAGAVGTSGMQHEFEITLAEIEE